MDSMYFVAEQRHKIIQKARQQDIVKGIIMAPLIMAMPIIFTWVLGMVSGL
jgi:hypothetical protein